MVEVMEADDSVATGRLTRGKGRLDNEQERGKNVEQEDVGRMMFKVERKQGEQKEKLRNGHERRRKGFLRKGKGRQSGKELQKLLEPLGPLFLIFFFFGLFAF